MVTSSGKHEFSSLIALFVWLVAALLVICEAKITNEPPNTNSNEFLGASAELQSLNCYLTGIEPLSLDPSEVAHHLDEARSLIDAIGDEVVRNGVEPDSAESKVRCLLGNNPDSLKTLLDSLIRASRLCDQESFDYLSLVRSQTFEGQFLHTYSQQQADACLGVQANLVAIKVEKTLAKLNSEVYELVANLAQAFVARDRKTNASRGKIVISDNQKSPDPSEVRRTLKQVKLDTLAQQSLFATMIRNYYAEQFPTGEEKRVRPADRRERLRGFYTRSLLNPCKELTKRWFDTLNNPTFVGIPKRMLAETIEGQRRYNFSLDWSIEMVRICRKLVEKSNSILSSVEK